MAENSVGNWLKSLDLYNYTQSFIDNGYDDLEICKQVGNPDLDAIGVESQDDRKKILEAVQSLNEKYGTPSELYRILEDQNIFNNDPPVRTTLDSLLTNVSPTDTSSLTFRSEKPSIPKAHDETLQGSLQDQFKPKIATVMYSKFELTVILRDKLIADNIDLTSPVYTAQDLSPCWSSLTALALKYAFEMNTQLVEVVLDRLEDIRWWQISADNISIYTPPSMSSSMEDRYCPSLCSYSPQGGPPPIPSDPPPSGSHLDGYGQLHSIQTRYADSPSHSNYVAVETGDSETLMEKKKTSTLSRLFRNIGFRSSSRKHSYKRHQGDLLAHQITMSENDRIALMQMVKEGKISTETALQVVKRFEEDRKKDETNVNETNKDKDKKNNGKSKKSTKPTKSPSISYTGDLPCEACNNIVIGNYPSTLNRSHNCQPYLENECHHQRVHSLNHITYPNPLRSPGAGRAMSYTPIRSNSSQNSVVNSPVGYITASPVSKIYTPVIHHELKMYSGSRGLYAVHGIDMIRDRLNAIKSSTCVHKTQSKASLISSESDNVTDYGSQPNTQSEPPQDDLYFCNNNSAVSMGSDSIPPSVDGRQKFSSTLEKVCSHKWQRTGSVSQGEDSTSTDTDDIDDQNRQLLDGGSSGSQRMEKLQGVKNEVRRRILQTKDIIGDGKSQHLCSAYQPGPGTNQTANSNDSCSSGLGSQSSQPWTDLDQSPGQWSGPVLGIARVHSNYLPTPNEKDFLHLRRWETVEVLEAASSGIWKGRIDNRVGYFHFNYVDMITDSTLFGQQKDKSKRRINRRSKPQSVEELLQRIGLDHLAPVFLLNGYDSLEIFAEIDNNDLNALNILDSESRTKLITAAELLVYNEYPQESFGRNIQSKLATPTNQSYAVPWTSFFPSKPLTGSRDSGCFDSNEFVNRENDPYRSVFPQNRDQIPVGCDNTENFGPSFIKKNVGIPVFPGICSDLSFRHVNGTNGAKEEKDKTEEIIYSEEDVEVRCITGYHGNTIDRSSPRSQNIGNGQDSDVHIQYRPLVPLLGPEWKVFSDAFSQTAAYGCVGESLHAAVDSDKIKPNMLSSAHGQMASTMRQKLKPFARKIPQSVLTNDAQVQVMCPLGQLTLHSPNFSSISEKCISQSTTDTRTTLAASQSLCSNIKSLTTPSVTIVNVFNSTSPIQDMAGSDAGTNKSDIVSGRSVDSTFDKDRITPDLQYGPVHKDFKAIKRSVIPKVTSKLASECIDLALEPYSLPDGACGIPPLLIQRYAEELKQDVYKTALILDQVRIHKLSTMGRPVIPAEKLTESSLASSELKIGTVQEFFISIGLPMYADAFLAKGCTTIEALVELSVKEVQAICSKDRKHLKRIVHALEWVQSQLKSLSWKIKTSPVTDKL